LASGVSACIHPCDRFASDFSMTSPGSRDRPLRDVFFTFSAVGLLCVIAGLLRRVPHGEEIAPTLVAGAFLFTALEKARRAPGGAARFGIALGGLLLPREEDSNLDLLTFVPYALAYAAWHAPSRPFSFDAIALAPSFVIGQLVVVALPEEAFFRGFVQSRLSEAFADRRTLFGVSLSLRALVLQAALFAVVHVLVDPHPARLAVFFPGLLFGFVREWRGGIGAALTYHALSNLFSEALFQGFF
jgi:membrane protease YdiL (CAAX protease family)